MSGFTDVFGGATLYPSGQSYLALTFSTDQTLAWPVEQQVGGNVVSSIMDLSASGAGLNVDIPDATQVSNGMQSVFNNVGANAITIRDSTGSTIISLAVGEAWVVYLRDNSTAAGLWRTFQLGASVSVATASALEGAGIKAIATTLNQKVTPVSTAVTPHTWIDSNRAQLTIWTGGVGILNLPTAGTVGSDWFAMARNDGSGDLTITPVAGTIDGSATLIMSAGESAIIITDGTNWFTVGHGQSTTSVFDFISIAVAGTGNYTLAGAELNRISYKFTGILTGDRTIIVPNSVQQYWVDNSTTGAFSLFVQTAAQVTPVEVLQDDRHILYSDGTDVLGAESATVTFPIVVSQGGTGANNAASARTNLDVPQTIIDMIAGTGLTGGGTLAADRTFNVIGGDGITANANDMALSATVAGLGLSYAAGVLSPDFSEYATVAPQFEDEIVFLDGTDGIIKRRIFTSVNQLFNANTLAGYDANEYIDHTAVSMGTAAAGGLAGGGTIASTRALVIDISGVASITAAGLDAADTMLVDDGDGGTNKKIAVQEMGMRVQLAQGTQTLAAADMNSIMEFTATSTLTLPLNATTALPVGVPIVLNMKHATQVLTVLADASVTLVSVNHPAGGAAASDTVDAGGTALLYKTAADVWCLSGDISN